MGCGGGSGVVVVEWCWGIRQDVCVQGDDPERRVVSSGTRSTSGGNGSAFGETVPVHETMSVSWLNDILVTDRVSSNHT